MSNTNENKTNMDITANEETVLKNPAVLGDDPQPTDVGKNEGSTDVIGDGESFTPMDERDADAGIAEIMYENLKGVFGAGSQLFTMEFPGRVLNRLDYAYPIEDYNSVLTKPYTVAEREFRLSDNMMDMNPIVQGPNGSYLSSIYNTTLNNYAPKITDLKDFVIDKMELRLFLLEKITDEIDGETITCSRMEFCQRTYLRYLENKYKWDQEKIEKHKVCNETGELEEYAKWLSTVSWTKDHELETLFNDAVVRGFYHEIMTILGFLDISSPAARLTAAKQNKRSSVRRSVDSSRDILPVQFEPSNWFRSLMPNYSPKDLTLDAGYLATEYKAKKALLSSLEAEVRLLSSYNTSSADIEAYQNDFDSAKAAMDKAEDEIAKIYSEAQIQAVKLAFEVVSNGEILAFIASCATSGGSTAATKALDNITKNTNFTKLFGSDKEGASLEDIETSIKGLIEKVYDMYSQNQKYFTAFEKLMEAQLALARSKTTDNDDQINILVEKIRLLRQEISQMAMVLATDAVNTDTPGSKATENTDLLPLTKYDEDTTFTDIVIHTSREQLDQKQSSTASTKNFRTGARWFFLNTSANVCKSASESEFIQKMMQKDFTIGMRVTKVTIDRGGWFDPSIYDISGSFMKIDSKIAAGAGITAESVMDVFSGNSSAYSNASKNTVHTDLIYDNDGKQGKYILPAFPTSFIIVKDVVVKFSNVTVDTVSYENFRSTTANASSHLFGFRLGGGSGSESHMGYVDETKETTTFYVRIPGPQILGWFMEMTPEDRSTNYESLSKSEFFNDVMAALKDYREKLGQINSVVQPSDGTITHII